MKKFLWAIFAAVVLAACSGADSYRINGTLQGVEDGIPVTLIVLDGDVPSVMDSAVVRNGKFVMKGQIDTCFMAFVAFDVDDDMAGCQLYLERGNINVEYNTASTVQKVSGTPCNDAFQKFYDSTLQFDEEVEELQDKLQVTLATNGDGHAIVDEMNVIQDRFRDLVESSIRENTDNLFGYQQLQQYFEFFEPEEDLDLLQLFYPSFGKDIAFLNMTLTLQHQLPSTVGHQFIDFSANILDRRNQFKNMASLSDYVNSSKLVYLVFWSSYMPACASMANNLKVALDGYKSKGFQVVGVSVDDDTQAWINAVKEYGMTWPQLWNGDDLEHSAAYEYAVSALPMSFLIDYEGTIIGRNIQTDELETVLADYFK